LTSKATLSQKKIHTPAALEKDSKFTDIAVRVFVHGLFVVVGRLWRPGPATADRDGPVEPNGRESDPLGEPGAAAEIARHVRRRIDFPVVWGI
jgi:hypothetical protein